MLLLASTASLCYASVRRRMTIWGKHSKRWEKREGDTTPQRRDFTNDGTTVKVSAFMEELAAIAKNNIILSYIQLNIYTLYVNQ